MAEEGISPSTEMVSPPPQIPPPSSDPPESPMLKPSSEPAKSPPPRLATYLSNTSHTITRIDRLFTTTAGLESTLSTLNYALYLLHATHSSSPLQRLLTILFSSRASKSPSSKPNPSKLAALASLISDTRTTLRLLGLIPLITWTRSTLNSPHPDRILQTISLAQCATIIIYQALENAVTLSRKNIIDRSLLARFGGELKWELWSTRAWLGYVLCEFGRIYRSSVLLDRKQEAQRKADSEAEPGEKSVVVVEAEREEEKKERSALWTALVSNSAWFPLCVHWSLEDGLGGVGEGIVGALGLLAGSAGIRRAWAATA